MFTQISESKKYLLVAGKKIKATILVSYGEEADSIEGSFDFGSDSENNEYAERFYSGELASVCIRVQAIWQGQEGTDYLGSCHVVSSKVESEVELMSKEYSMIETALTDLKTNIERQIELFSGFSKRA